MANYNPENAAQLKHVASLAQKTGAAIAALDEKYDGAEPNKIDTVKVNGSALTPDAQKTVNIDISGKVDKVTTATSGNIVVFGADGALVDSGIKFASDADVNAMLEEYFPSSNP